MLLMHKFILYGGLIHNAIVVSHGFFTCAPQLSNSGVSGTIEACYTSFSAAGFSTRGYGLITQRPLLHIQPIVGGRIEHIYPLYYTPTHRKMHAQQNGLKHEKTLPPIFSALFSSFLRPLCILFTNNVTFYLRGSVSIFLLP